MGKEYSFQQMVLGQLDIHMQKNKVGSLSYTIHKANSKWIKNLNIFNKISYKDILYNMGNIANIYNNYKWSITFKNCESLYCTPVTYNIVQLYASIKK